MADDLVGRVTVVLVSQVALDQEDACNQCRRRLSDLYAIYLADCGRYCSRGCLEAHADTLRANARVLRLEASMRMHFKFENAGLFRPMTNARGDDDPDV